MAAIPPALTGWFRSSYPTLQIDEQWLADCVEYLTTHFDNQTTQQLIQRVNEQLCASDLRDSVAPPGPLARLQHDEHGFDLSRTKGVLVQITSITEIGHSAISLRDAHQKKKEESAGGPVVVGNVEEAQQGPTKYPRSMLSMQLSDGYTTLKGIEYEKLPFLDLGDTPLGAKLLLKACRVRRGVALLTSATALWKKGAVQEMQEVAEEQLLDGFALRIEEQNDHKQAKNRKPALPRQTADARPAPAQKRAQPPPPPQTMLVEDEGLMDDDLDLTMADFEEEEAMTASAPKQRPDPIVPQLDVYSDDEFDDAYGDEIWPEEEPKPAPTRSIAKEATVISLSSE